MMNKDDELAVKVRSVVKSYGSNVILNKLDMSVPYGSIFGLLGASGCGKTTLLHCIVGRLKISSGDITVFGKPPGSPGHNIPGKNVGYMPQEIGLYSYFSMSETLYYFGILHGMKIKDIRARRDFLQEFLELPPSHKLIRTLSGGQQKRFSFAVAILQEPPFMILDEPTVGVDPILRAKLWEHLINLVSSKHVTIILTTHYIEEARQANIVGMMRDGKLLAEGSPSSLIETYRLNTLENVFLQLCQSQDQESKEMTEPKYSEKSFLMKERADDQSSHMVNDQDNSTTEKQPETFPTTEKQVEAKTFYEKVSGIVTPLTICKRDHTSILPQPKNIAALCWKNLMRIYRNITLLIFQFMIPAIEVTLFALAVGSDIKDLTVSYTNNDYGLPFNSSLSVFCNNTDIDNRLSNLGDFFVSTLSNDDTFKMENYDKLEDAINRVKSGKAWIALYLGSNFTVNLLEKLCILNPSRCNDEMSISLTDEIVNGSTVHIYPDVTNFEITTLINEHIETDYDIFLKQVISACNSTFDINSYTITQDVVLEQPVIYGSSEISFLDYVAPMIIIATVSLYSINLCAIVLIVERKEGLLDRTWMAGVNTTELILSHLLIQTCILLVQTTILLGVSIYGIQVYTADKQELWVIACITMIEGLAGMGYGLLLSAICTTEVASLTGSTALFTPSIILSGVLWPMEGIPQWLRYICYALPTTYGIQALRVVLGRGWGFAHIAVMKGLLVPFGWFILFLILTSLAFNA